LWKGGDAGLIDGVMVNGLGTSSAGFATLVRLFQTGHIYHYAFAMIIGVFVLMTLGSRASELKKDWERYVMHGTSLSLAIWLPILGAGPGAGDRLRSQCRWHGCSRCWSRSPASW
jgi:hypothetical protein